MKSQTINTQKFIWVLTTRYFLDDMPLHSSYYFTSKDDAISHAKNSASYNCIYTLEDDFKKLTNTLFVAHARKFDGVLSFVTLTREILR